MKQRRLQMHGYRDESLENLVKAIINIDSEEECYAFLDDLCTIRELQDMAQRFETAVLLTNGMNYQQIAEKVGASTATISRVNRCLQYGEGGYKAVIEKIGKQD